MWRIRNIKYANILDVFFLGFLLSFAAKILFLTNIYIQEGDAYQHAYYSIQFSRFLLNADCFGYINAITHSTWIVAPLQMVWGSFFVCCAPFLGGVIRALYFSQFIALALTVYFIFKILILLFKERLVAYTGVLLFVMSPFVCSLTYAYMQELFQLLCVAGFIYTVVLFLEKRTSHTADVLKIVLMSLVCFMVRIHAVIQLLIPLMVVLFFLGKRIKNHSVEFDLSLRVFFYFIGIVSMLFLLEQFYMSNLRNWSSYYELACVDTYWPWVVHLPLLKKIAWSGTSLANGYFFSRSIFYIISLLTGYAFFLRKVRYPQVVRIILICAWLNLAIIFIFFTFQIRSFELPRYLSAAAIWVTLIIISSIYKIRYYFGKLPVIILGGILVLMIIFNNVFFNHKTITLYAPDRAKSNIFFYTAITPKLNVYLRNLTEIVTQIDGRSTVQDDSLLKYYIASDISQVSLDLFAFDQRYKDIKNSTVWVSDFHGIVCYYRRAHNGTLNLSAILQKYILENKKVLFIVDKSANGLSQRYGGGEPAIDRGWLKDVVYCLSIMQRNGILQYKSFYFKNSQNNFDVYYKL